MLYSAFHLQLDVRRRPLHLHRKYFNNPFFYPILDSHVIFFYLCFIWCSASPIANMVRCKYSYGTTGILTPLYRSVSLKSLKISRKVGKCLSEVKEEGRDIHFFLVDLFPNELFQNTRMKDVGNSLKWPLPTNFQKSVRCNWIPLQDELNINRHKGEIIILVIQKKTKLTGLWGKCADVKNAYLH